MVTYVRTGTDHLSSVRTHTQAYSGLAKSARQVGCQVNLTNSRGTCALIGAEQKSGLCLQLPDILVREEQQIG